MGKTIDECLFEIFSKQQAATATRRLKIYKSRFFRQGLPYRTKIKILTENGYLKMREELFCKKK